MRGVYAIIDVSDLSKRNLDPLGFADRVLASQPCALQLRHKLGSSRDVLALGTELARRAQRRSIPFFLNDRADLALLCGATGVHVGQDDLPIGEVRRNCPALKIGLSTHGLDQAASALKAGPDYLALGPVFTTASKRDPEPTVGLDVLSQVSYRCARQRVPLVAIGGISADSLANVATWADAIALISGLHPREGFPLDAHLAALAEGVREAPLRPSSCVP